MKTFCLSWMILAGGLVGFGVGRGLPGLICFGVLAFAFAMLFSIYITTTPKR